VSYVAIIGGVVSLGGAAIKADAAENQADARIAGGGGGGGGFTSPSAASYGTTIGNDGWSINFGSGSQIATPSETNTASYPQQANPLASLQPRLELDQAGAAPMDPTTLIACALGGLVLVKALRK
jgi:hypothetical protein